MKTLSAGKIFGLLAGTVILCCLFIGLYSVSMYLIVKKDVHIFPTSTLDLACEDTYCLNACINHIRDFEIPSLNEYRDELLEQPLGYELARYRLEDDGQLKRIATPAIPDYLKPYQDNTELHQRIWDYSTGIFPNDAKMHLSYMIVYVNMNESRA